MAERSITITDKDTSQVISEINKGEVTLNSLRKKFGSYKIYKVLDALDKFNRQLNYEFKKMEQQLNASVRTIGEIRLITEKKKKAGAKKQTHLSMNPEFKIVDQTDSSMIIGFNTSKTKES